MRRDLGEDMHRALSKHSATRSPGHANVDEALEYAMRYGRGIDKETCRRFVLMYVNDFTLGPRPRRPRRHRTPVHLWPTAKA